MTTTECDIKEVMANAKKQIEEIKSRQKISGQQNEDRLSAFAALQARISSSFGNLEMKGLLTVSQQQIEQQKLVKLQTAEERDKSLNLVIDAEGRTIDKRTGQVVELQSRLPTLKANLKIQQKKSTKTKTSDLQQQQKEQKDIISKEDKNQFVFSKTQIEDKQQDETSANSTYFDARLKLKTNVRNKRKLVFHEKGTFESLAKKLRNEAKLKSLTSEINLISKKTGILSESKLALIQPKRYLRETHVPDIEWWDYAILNEPTYDCLDILNEIELKEKLKLTNLIEHPVQMKPPSSSDKKVIPKVFLTKKELKKLRRQNRSEALKEEQEKIRLGLMPPPEPKVKISNLMRVLGTEAVQDPTKVEEYVRNQMAKRQKMHEEQNAKRKLTPEQRAEKKKRKIMENTTASVHVSVYRIKDLSDPSTKFKIEANCNQLHMTGSVVLCESLNVVVVEGGPKQQRKFKRLMLNRIKWSELVNKKQQKENNENSDYNKDNRNSCSLIWEGMIKQRNFSNIIYKSCPTASSAREYFKHHNCEQYWDLAQSDAILEMSSI